MSFLSYAYTNEVTFAPLQTSMHESDLVAGAEAQQRRACSPRSMYSLATAVGASYGYLTLGVDMLKAWDPGHQGSRTKGHSIQTFYHQHCARTLHLLRCKVGVYQFCSFIFSCLDPFSHKVVMDMEIQFLHDSFTERDPRLLMGHIQRMAFGEAPFFAATLGLVYEKLVEKAFARPVPSGFGFGKSVEVESVADPCSTLQASSSVSGTPQTSTSSNASSVSSSVPKTPSRRPKPVSPSVGLRLAWVQCHRCFFSAGLGDLSDGLYCPQCPPEDLRGSLSMQCSLCGTIRTARRDICPKLGCGAIFSRSKKKK